ncbi:Uncharacterized protein TCM_041852 isoform 2, partial [Theobroma cacao]
KKFSIRVLNLKKFIISDLPFSFSFGTQRAAGDTRWQMA